MNYTTAFVPLAVAVADFNGDRKPDLVVLNECGTDPNCGEQTGGSLSVFLGNGDGTFPAATIYDLVFHPVAVAVGDFNGDGNLDLALGSGDDNDRNVAILLGNGDGTFGVPVYYVAGVQVNSLAVADFDGDHNPDLVVVTIAYTPHVSVLLGNINGTFQTPVYYSSSPYPWRLAVGDFNGDRKPDLAVANQDESLSVLLNNGDGTFKAAVNYSDQGSPQSVAVGDFNGDGKPDLVTANSQYDRVSVFLGNGDGTFQPATNFGTGYYPYWVSVGDFNGDGKPDLAVANALDNTVSIFLNSSAPSGPAMITSPTPNSTLTGSSVTFQWTSSGSATAYWIDVGSTAGGNQYYQSGSLPTSILSATASGLPTDGGTVYVTLYSLIAGQWVHNDYTYTAFNVGGAKGVITIPTPGSMFTGSTVTFGWTAGTGATAYWLDIGSSAGGNQYYQSGNLGNVLTTTVNGLPTDGSTVYVTLYSLVGGQWLSNTYTYTAFNLAGAKGVITTPTPSSTLTGSSVIFTWTAGQGATNYWVDIGSSAGGNQYYQSGNLGNVLTTTANGLPTDGSTVYVTLYSLVGGQWLSNTYTYTAFNLATAQGVLTTPTPGSTLSGSTMTFDWMAGSGASSYWLDVGSTSGGNQYFQSGDLGNVLTTTVSGLPTDGSTIYVTLYSKIGGTWYHTAYTYTAYAPVVTFLAAVNYNTDSIPTRSGSRRLQPRRRATTW